MGTFLSTKKLRGFGIPDVRLKFDAVTAAFTTVTEAGPQPGSPVGADTRSRLLPVFSGGQTVDADLSVTAAGNPGLVPDASCRVAYKTDAEADTEYRGWSGFEYLNRWPVLEYTTINDISNHDCVTISSTQQVVAVYGDDLNSFAIRVRVLDPTTWAWGASVTVQNAFINREMAISILPDERLIVLLADAGGGAAVRWLVRDSDDAGATWSDYSINPFGSLDAASFMGAGSTSLRRARMVSVKDQVLFTREGVLTAVPTFAQFASSSLGTSFIQIGGDWTTAPPTNHSTVKLPSGKLGLVYTNGTTDVRIKVIGNAFEELESAPSTLVLTGDFTDGLGSIVDADGAWWVFATDDPRTRVLVSYDEGTTWQAPPNSTDVALFDSKTAGIFLNNFSGCAANGSGVLLHQWEGPTTAFDGSLASMILGGWSNVESDEWDEATTELGLTWMAIERPGSYSSYTAIGVGTDVLQTPGELRITTVANTREFAFTIPSPIENGKWLMELAVILGGSLAANQVGMCMRQDDSVNLARFELNFASTGFRIIDTSGATIGSDAVISMATPLQVKVEYDAAADEVRSFFRRPGDDNWIAGPFGSVNRVATAALSSFVQWGHVALSTSTSDWSMFHFQLSTGSIPFRTGLDELRGKALSALPYPTVDLDTVAASNFVALLAGPGRKNETWDINRTFDNGLEKVFTELHPSPDEQWLTTDETEAFFSFKFLDSGGTQIRTSLGNTSLFMYVGNTNVATVVLEGRNNSAGGYTNIGTLDLTKDFTGLGYTKNSGDSLTPSGSGDATRYLWNQELVTGGRGSADFGSGDIRRIRRQTEGDWNNTSLTRRPRIWVDGVLNLISGTGTMTLRHHSGLLIAHEIPVFDEYRVRIPAQTTADGRFEVGVILIGGLHPAGKQWARGFGWNYARNVTTRRSRAGTTRVREEGRVRRTLSVDWADNVDLTFVRNLNPNYLANISSDPLAAQDDVPFWLTGILEDVSGGEVPVIAIADIPLVPVGNDTTLTDPDLYVYGRIVGDVRVEHVVGEEGIDELYRVQSVPVEEIV